MPILNMIAQGSGGGGGGSNVGEPTNLSAAATSNTSIEIKWTDNNLQALPPSTFQKSVLVRKVGSAPTTPSDGTTVVTETVMNTYQSSAYSDTGLTQGTTYYYQVFSYSADGGITYGTAVSATTSSPWQPGVNTLLYMPLDGDVLDYSGNNNNGTIDGSVSFSTIGTKQYAVFNGGAIDLTSLPVSGDQTFTQSAWMKLNSYGVSYMHLFGQDTLRARSNVIVAYKNSHIPINDTYGIDLNMGSAIPTSWYGTWKYCVYVHDGSSNKIYIDGSLYGETSGSLDIRAGYNKYIGRAVPEIELQGYGMSECIIEDVVWTAQEASDYYNFTKANYGIS